MCHRNLHRPTPSIDQSSATVEHPALRFFLTRLVAMFVKLNTETQTWSAKQPGDPFTSRSLGGLGGLEFAKDALEMK